MKRITIEQGKLTTQGTKPAILGKIAYSLKDVTIEQCLKEYLNLNHLITKGRFSIELNANYNDVKFILHASDIPAKYLHVEDWTLIKDATSPNVRYYYYYNPENWAI